MRLTSFLLVLALVGCGAEPGDTPSQVKSPATDSSDSQVPVTNPRSDWADDFAEQVKAARSNEPTGPLSPPFKLANPKGLPPDPNIQTFGPKPLRPDQFEDAPKHSAEDCMTLASCVWTIDRFATEDFNVNVIKGGNDIRSSLVMYCYDWAVEYSFHDNYVKKDFTKRNAVKSQILMGFRTRDLEKRVRILNDHTLAYWCDNQYWLILRAGNRPGQQNQPLSITAESL